MVAFTLFLLRDRLVSLVLSKALPPSLQVGLPRRLGADPEQGYQLLEIVASTRGADGPASTTDQRFELVAAGATSIFVERHDVSISRSRPL